MKILKKKKKKIEIGKKSPKSHWERGRISAPEDTKKNPWDITCMSPGTIPGLQEVKRSCTTTPHSLFSNNITMRSDNRAHRSQGPADITKLPER